MSHHCPRPECSRMVPDEMFACRGDWYALPKALRDAIWEGHRARDVEAHAAAMAQATEWYREHPPRYATRAGMAARYTRSDLRHETPRVTRTSGENGEDLL